MSQKTAEIKAFGTLGMTGSLFLLLTYDRKRLYLCLMKKVYEEDRHELQIDRFGHGRDTFDDG